MQAATPGRIARCQVLVLTSNRVSTSRVSLGAYLADFIAPWRDLAASWRFVRHIGGNASLAPCNFLAHHPNTIHADGGEQAMDNVRQLRERGDSEKITINLGYVDLGRIDLLVQEGFYANRTDFIGRRSATS